MLLQCVPLTALISIRGRKSCQYIVIPVIFRLWKSELLFPHPGQCSPSFSLQSHQSSVLQHLLHRSPLFLNTLLHILQHIQNPNEGTFPQINTSQIRVVMCVFYLGSVCLFAAIRFPDGLLQQDVCPSQFSHEGNQFLK